MRTVTSGSRRASDISDSRSCLSRYAVIRDQRASCVISRASSGEPRKSRVPSPKGGGAAGVPRSSPAGLPRLLAGTRWRGERCARYAFISSASSNPSQSVDRSAGLSACLPACLLAVCSNKKVSNGGRWTPVGAAGWAGRGGRYRFHPAWRGERPPPPLHSAAPPRASSPSKQPTHFGSPGQSSRPPAHCCFSSEMGLLAAVLAADVAWPFFRKRTRARGSAPSLPLCVFTVAGNDDAAQRD